MIYSEILKVQESLPLRTGCSVEFWRGQLLKAVADADRMYSRGETDLAAGHLTASLMFIAVSLLQELREQDPSHGLKVKGW